MEKIISKSRISISIDKQLFDILNEEFNNKSKYVEHLIYLDLLKKGKNDRIKIILI